VNSKESEEYLKKLEKILEYDRSRVIKGTSELKKIEKTLNQIRKCFNGTILYRYDPELGKAPQPYLQIGEALEYIQKAIKEAKKIEFKSIR